MIKTILIANIVVAALYLVWHIIVFAFTKRTVK